MSLRGDRLARQAEIEREFEEDQNERLIAEAHVTPAPRPEEGSPEYCAVSLSRRHSWWTSKQDGKQRCYSCCRVRP